MGSWTRLGVVALVVGSVTTVSIDVDAQRTDRRGGRRAPDPVAEAPLDPVEARYRALIEQAVGEFALAHYEEAITLFEQAYAVKASARAMRGIAKARFELRQYQRTIDACEASLGSTVDPLDDALRAEVVALRDRAAGFVGTVRLVHAPAQAEVLLDGRALDPSELTQAIPLDQGSHTLDVTATGYAPSHRQVEVTGGAATEIRIVLVALTPEDTSHTIRWIGVGTAGLGVVGLLVTAPWMANRGNALDECSSLASRGGQCTNGDDIASQRNVASGMLATSTLLIAAGSALVVVDILRSRGHDDDAPSVACAPGPQSFSCVGAMTW